MQSLLRCCLVHQDVQGRASVLLLPRQVWFPELARHFRFHQTGSDDVDCDAASGVGCRCGERDFDVSSFCGRNRFVVGESDLCCG